MVGPAAHGGACCHTGLNGRRVRAPGNPSDEAVQNRQWEALQLGLACTSTIRNRASRGDEEWDEQPALEQLAVLSVFARLVDECLVVTA